MKTKNIYLIRHGETDWNRDKRFQGQTDITLNPTGRQQAESLISSMNSLKIEAAYSSNLSRAHETAQIALQELKLIIQKDERLREANVGEVEGLTLEEIEAKYGAHGVARWRSYEERDMDFRYLNGESKRQILVRIRAVLLEIAQNSDRQNLAVFAHGMVMRALTFAFNQGVPWDHAVFANGSIHHFVWEENRPEFLKYLGKVNG